jgi:hypothetical protein
MQRRRYPDITLAGFHKVPKGQRQKLGSARDKTFDGTMLCHFMLVETERGQIICVVLTLLSSHVAILIIVHCAFLREQLP